MPIYQRHYVWTRDKQWEPFWTEIRTKAIERLAGRDRRFSHYMGALVLETRGGFLAGKVPTFQVVDGQQRLTTFQVFLSALRDIAREMSFDQTAQKIGTYILNDRPDLMDDPEVETLKVWPTQYDREMFIDIITESGIDFLRAKYVQYFYKKYHNRVYSYSTTPNLLGAYGYFRERIFHSVVTDDLDDEFSDQPDEDLEDVDEPSEANATDDRAKELRLIALWQALVEEFKVVQIVLEEGDDAQVIFETLNERGEPLLAADLVRNNIFQRADKGNEKPDKLFDTHWKPFEHPFWQIEEKQGRYKKPRIDFFLANHIAGKIATEVSLTKLFSEYKAYIKTQPFLSVSEEVQDLARFGGVYRNLVGREENNTLSLFGNRLRPWDVTTVYPLAMRLWGQKDIDVETKSACLDLLMTFIVRRAVCKLTNKNYNKFFLSIVAQLDKTEWTRERLAEVLLEQSSETSRFPRDGEFKRSWLAEPIYTSLGPMKTQALLRELEVVRRTRFQEALKGGVELDDSEWLQTWYAPEDDSPVGLAVRRKRMIHTVGNLTLLTKPLNKKVSNGPFDGKKEKIQEHSLLALNREITKRKTWDEDAILARGESLFETAKTIWPEPS